MSPEEDPAPEPSKPSADDLLDEYLLLRERGEVESFEAWLAGHPGREAELRLAQSHWRRGMGMLEESSTVLGLRLTPGRVLGDFRLVAPLGRGGQGTVWEARQLSLARSVALKLARHGSEDERALAFFEREAKAGGRLVHPGIVATYAHGLVEGTPWISQELVPGGRSLRDLIEEARLAPDLALAHYRRMAELVAQVADALAAAHAAGVIHRDVKPANILLAPDGRPKVTDFGLARVVDDVSQSRSGEVLGTYLYMSPEQVAGRRNAIDERTDVFSLGVVLYELLTLQRPFEGDTAQQICSKIQLVDPPDPRRIRSRCPAELAVICSKAIEKSPADRYRDMPEMAADLRRHLANEPILAKPPTRVERVAKWAKRNPARAASAAIASVTFTIIALLLAMNLRTNAALSASNRALDESLSRATTLLHRSQLEEARAWLERADSAEASNESFKAALFSARAIGFSGFGREEADARMRNAQPRTRRLLRSVVHIPWLAGGELPPFEAERKGVAREAAAYLRRNTNGFLLWSSPVRAHHTGVISSVAFRPDGIRLASASEDCTIKIWDAQSGQRLLTLANHAGAATSVAFSPDGIKLASASEDGTIGIWDTESGSQLLTLQGHEGAVSSVVFAANGTRLASASKDGTVKLWDTLRGYEAATLVGHEAAVASVAFSPDGSRLASGSSDRTVKLWDPSNGREIATLTGHSTEVSSVAFSPDGSRVASASKDKSIKLWDAATLRELSTLAGHWDEVICVAFSPDGGRIASGSFDDTIKLWDATDGRELATFEGLGPGIVSIAFSPDGSRLAIGSDDHSVRLWDITSGHEIAPRRGHEGTIWDVAFSPDGSCLATASDDKTIKLWDVASGVEIATLVGHGPVAFSPDGSILVSGSLDGTAKLWDVVSGSEVATLAGHDDAVSCVVFSPNGRRLASGSEDSTIRLWDTATGLEVAALAGQRGAVTSVAFSSDGGRLASGRSDTIEIWDLAAGRKTATLKHGGLVTSVTFGPNGGQLASASLDGTVKLWDAPNGEEFAELDNRRDLVAHSVRETQSLLGHRHGVTSVTFSPDGSRLATGSLDDTVKLWDVMDGREIATLVGHGDAVWSVAFSSDGSRLASASSDTVELWDASVGRELATLGGHRSLVTSVAFSPDGSRLASGGLDDKVKLWDTASRRELATLEGHRGLVTSVTFRPDGSQIASGSDDGTVKLWSTASGRLLQTLAGHGSWVTSVAFNRDGGRLASGSGDNTVRLWDTASGRVLQTLMGHARWITSVAFSSDGSRLASGSLDKTVKLWDAGSGRELATFSGHKKSVTSVAFGPTGHVLATGSDDSSVRIWDVSSGSELATLTGHESGVTSVAFTSDGGRLVSGSLDGTIKLWDTASHRELATLQGRETLDGRETIKAVAFSPDGRFVASGDSGNAVKLWSTVAPGMAMPEPSAAALPTLLDRALLGPLRLGAGRELVPATSDSLLVPLGFPMQHARYDEVAQLARSGLDPLEATQLRISYLARTRQWRACIRQWHIAVSVASIPDDSSTRISYCTYLLLLARDAIEAFRLPDADELLNEARSAINSTLSCPLGLPLHSLARVIIACDPELELTPIRASALALLEIAQPWYPDSPEFGEASVRLRASLLDPK